MPNIIVIVLLAVVASAKSKSYCQFGGGCYGNSPYLQPYLPQPYPVLPQFQYPQEPPIFFQAPVLPPLPLQPQVIPQFIPGRPPWPIFQINAFAPKQNGTGGGDSYKVEVYACPDIRKSSCYQRKQLDNSEPEVCKSHNSCQETGKEFALCCFDPCLEHKVCKPYHTLIVNQSP